jgi:hypothetical protein
MAQPQEQIRAWLLNVSLLFFNQLNALEGLSTFSAVEKAVRLLGVVRNSFCAGYPKNIIIYFLEWCFVQ